MYSREEAKKLKENFWTAFGQYMSVMPSADNEKVNWVNYKTGIKHLYFRMDATNKSANIFIEISHPDESIRQLMLSQFIEMKTIFDDMMQEEWVWDKDYYDESGKVTSRISCSISKISVFNKQYWPELISFFKPRIIALDEFWSLAKYSFDIFK
ncbi:DUF4268 domain-containing protein [Sphingobacterium bovistauri]|uniref:DUF4268 domain-containing protein n=1 Tax=Sphingobacterium bovistauri TaxID=2781959 RepID=A0ABS7Z5M2_9SPHI|nr:DUF4268 domain-containing protein [Sphingobacterium bovistauri]MCA5004877.1 DUF4268 domain-containing protein [Sphingobacterium bovistauri]